MHRPSFLAGLLAGTVAAVLVAVAVPGIVPAPDQAHPRAPGHVVVQHDDAPLPPRTSEDASPRQATGAGRPEALGTDAVEAPGELDLALARLETNRNAAIATLRNIISAQSQFQTTARADENNNGVGEHGSFGELSGEIGVRDGDFLNPPVLSTAFRRVVHGYVVRSGYRFRLYLPGANGAPVCERDRGGFGAGKTNPELAEALWCVYAWPVEGDEPTFFTNQEGYILTTSGYVGEREPPAFAAFKDASGIAAPTVMDLPEDRRIGADRQEWKQAD